MWRYSEDKSYRRLREKTEWGRKGDGNFLFSYQFLFLWKCFKRFLLSYLFEWYVNYVIEYFLPINSVLKEALKCKVFWSSAFEIRIDLKSVKSWKREVSGFLLELRAPSIYNDSIPIKMSLKGCPNINFELFAP